MGDDIKMDLMEGSSPSIQIIFFEGSDQLEALVNLVVMLESFSIRRKQVQFVK
jgi:hypothetical protein